MRNDLLRGIYPPVTGILFGLLQTGLYFQLSFALSSSFQTFLMITVCWLIGSAIGVQVTRKIMLRQAWVYGLLLLMLAAYFACALLLSAEPFNTGLWPIYALLIIMTGLYPGVFFVRMGRVYTARTLFLWENNGFIIGIITATMLFLLMGRGILWAVPLIFAAAILILPEPTPIPKTVQQQHEAEIATS